MSAAHASNWLAVNAVHDSIVGDTSAAAGRL
jgi:hypothetical protein